MVLFVLRKMEGMSTMKLKLIKASKEYKEQICSMLDEWYSTGEKIIPYSIRKNDYHDFDIY